MACAGRDTAARTGSDKPDAMRGLGACEIVRLISRLERVSRLNVASCSHRNSDGNVVRLAAPQVVSALAIIQLASQPGWPNLFARHPVANLANLAPPKRRGPFINNDFELGLLRNDRVTGGVLFRGGLSISRRHPRSPQDRPASPVPPHAEIGGLSRGDCPRSQMGFSLRHTICFPKSGSR